MSGRFDDFEGTPLGHALKALVEQQHRLVEFKAFSREGFPAVTALVSEVAQIFNDYDVTDTKERNFAKQSVGDFVARIMRAADYEKLGQRSVPGKTFTVGALWKPKTG